MKSFGIDLSGLWDIIEVKVVASSDLKIYLKNMILMSRKKEVFLNTNEQ